ncbi:MULTISPECIES: archease [Halobellus]|uniref:archease n=1 Tax=Halobellus TaxID=1073986 RepID=UPI0021159653|nr:MULTISPECIES: archease [Halobellus]MDQ2055184.1 archease [Halobellus sp. H-GB7]
MSFELREHTADVAVEATASDLSALFGAVADGLAAASCDDIPPARTDEAAEGADRTEDSGRTFEVSVSAENREALLFDYLDELIYERDVRSVLPVDNRVQIDRLDADADTGDAESAWELTATYRGVPLADIDAREVKAVTYSEMRVEQTENGWVAYVVFDV